MTSRRWTALAVGGGLAASAVVVPVLLAHLGFFRIRQVELIGVRYLTPAAVLDALAIDSTRNLFEGGGDIERRAERINGVIAARVERRLPATLRVHITEQVPMAFSPGPDGFVVVDGHGRPLPYDPLEGRIDLPVVARPDTLLVRTLGAVRFANPDLYDLVEWVDFAPGGGIELLEPGGRVIVDPMPVAEVVDAIRAVREQLARRGQEYRELDARVAGWVIVRRSRA